MKFLVKAVLTPQPGMVPSDTDLMGYVQLEDYFKKTDFILIDPEADFDLADVKIISIEQAGLEILGIGEEEDSGGE